jgi:hypothetical protein
MCRLDMRRLLRRPNRLVIKKCSRFCALIQADSNWLLTSRLVMVLLLSSIGAFPPYTLEGSAGETTAAGILRNSVILLQFTTQ